MIEDEDDVPPGWFLLTPGTRSSLTSSCLLVLQGDDTWATMLGQSVRLQPVPIQSLSELERARLQEVALYHLDERDLDFKISIPKGTDKLSGKLTLDSHSFKQDIK